MAFGSTKVDGKSIGFMPVPVCLTEQELVVIAKDGVRRYARTGLGVTEVGGSRLSGGSLNLSGPAEIKISGIRPHDAAELFASHMPAADARIERVEVAPTTSATPTTAPDWYPDPTERHHYRYWDGLRWTEDVATDGVVGTDPLVDQ